MKLGVVTAVHTDGSFDLVMTDTWMPVARVQGCGDLPASDMGHWDVPSVQTRDLGRSGGQPATNRPPLVAVVDQANGRPIVMGFLRPADGELAFSQADRKVYRHGSGAYTTTAPDGYDPRPCPSGSYVRIGTGAHEPLAPLSTNQTWQEIADARRIQPSPCNRPRRP